MASRIPRNWDIFCNVIDNLGDIGIAWRLARQLHNEYGLNIRLWVDDLESFQLIRPEIDTAAENQIFAGVVISRWREQFPDVAPSDVVIEALACNLPASYERAMAERECPPVWINLEYLSAEDWVIGCHGLPSPHPRLPLTKHFFMPGYVVGTGGILKERWLDERRDAFQGDRTARDGFWENLGIPCERSDEIRVSLFSYPFAPIGSLMRAWEHGDEKVRCIVTAGRHIKAVESYFGNVSMVPGNVLSQGALTMHVLPMLDQDTYDQLLWACDCNFVRGEDSFTRAQWAGKALIWQAYRQKDEAQWPKIRAFLDMYCRDLDPSTAGALGQMWRQWNANEDVTLAWRAFQRRLESMRQHAEGWRKKLDMIGDLAGNLVNFCQENI